MSAERRAGSDVVGRRAALIAGVSGVSALAGGCLGRAQQMVTDRRAGLSVRVTTVPADDDRQAVELARELASNLQAVGIRARLDLRTTVEFRRTVLFDWDFECYVGRYPWVSSSDPHYLYGLLHSRYREEPGWQNPFGYANISLDEDLDAQRMASESDRPAAVERVFEHLVVEKPFVPLCVPRAVRLARTDQVEGVRDGHLGKRSGYLGLELASTDDRLVTTTMDGRATWNLNPLAAHYREHGLFVDLLYDSLAAEVDGEYTPWLAVDWEHQDEAVQVRLREGCQFHDDERVTADDVAFTYEFLSDTSMGNAESAVPAPVYRTQTALVDDVSVVDDHIVSLTIDAAPAVADSVLNVPILPEHIWRPELESQLDDVGHSRNEWAPLGSEDVPVVGSGPYMLTDRSEGSKLVLTHHDEHFSVGADEVALSGTVPELAVRVEPSSASALGQVERGRAALTLTPLESHVVSRSKQSEEVETVEDHPRSFYHVGFNVRTPPFSNPRFRRCLAGLLDRSSLVDSVFDGHATPTNVPVDADWIPDHLEWGGNDPETPFFGTGGDLDEERARAAFRATGYRYDDRGRLRVTD